MKIKDDKEEDSLQYFQDSYQKAGWFSNIFYTWMSPLVMYVYKRKSLDSCQQCVQQTIDVSSQNLCNKITDNLEYLKKKNKFDNKWGVIRLVLMTLKWDVIKTVLFG
jgi:hypothetical protein